ncbi:MAG: putative nucleic acid-binding protein [Lentimonas sp.]|jgi:predicted nucleic acid-binding protein
MSPQAILPDVNLLLAYGWRSHFKHELCRYWLDSVPSFLTCPITELGFLRVSMSPGYRASIVDAMRVLDSITQKNNSQAIHCDIPASVIEKVTNYKDTTDAYLVELSKTHSCRLATLDGALVSANWAQGTAYNPLDG